MNVKAYFDNLPKAYVLALGALILVAVGGLDYITGPEFSVSILYLVPVLLVSWYAGKVSGMAASFAGALVWLIAGLLGKGYHEHPIELYWNDVMELAFFLVVSVLISALKDSLQREKKFATTDYLTGLPNKRWFYEFAEKEINRSLRYNHPLTIIYMDIDNFKTVNDTMGHEAGNKLLQLVANTFRDSIRVTDMVARLGGDEFALLLPESGAEAASSVVQVATTRLKEVLKDDWPVTLSIGMVTYLKPPATVDELLKTADDLMYSVKQAGKGSVRHEVVID